MGLFEKIFKSNKSIEATSYFKMLNGYTPIFTDYHGSLYEMELTRAAIHSFATACSKLKPEIQGNAYKSLEKVLQFKPNPYMDTSKFLYRIATIFSVCNNAFIIPLFDDFGYICGYYPILPQNCEVIEAKGEPFLRYVFANGQKTVIEFDKVGILTQFQYKNDFFGEDNSVLNPTMKLIHTQNEGIINGVKNSASIRFLAKVAQVLDPKDIENERKRFAKQNLSTKNQSGLILYDQKFEDLKPIESKPFIINPVQMKLINENVYTYFGTNEDILQNKYDENGWGAYYESKIEPWAIQLSLVMSNMTYTQREIAHGNSITWTANRLQYASNASKLNISTQLFDRGLITPNMVADIWNWPHREDGDKYYIRKEYTEVNNLDSESEENAKKQ